MLLQGEKESIRQKVCKKAKVKLGKNQKKTLSKRLKSAKKKCPIVKALFTQLKFFQINCGQDVFKYFRTH